MRRFRSIVLVAAVCAVAVVECAVRGVNPEVAGKYVEGSEFACFDGSKTIKWEMVNDDFCDCADSSDEPGTSACAGSHFFCKNQGYRSKILTSSFVDDGVCDCCDGSDEKSGLCPNICSTFGEEIRRSLLAEIDLHTQGVQKREEIRSESLGVVGTKRQRAEVIRQEMFPRSAQIEALKAQIAPVETIVNAHKEALKAAANLREESYKSRLEAAKEAEAQKQRAEGKTEEEIDTSAITALESLKSQLAPIEKDQEGQQRELTEIEEFLKREWGSNYEWAAMQNKCFSEFVRNYNYEVCLFSTAKQGTTDLGRFDKWDNNGMTQVYSNGARCWQGPNRSARVNMVCGLDHKITLVEEPETCLYHIQLATPMACSVEHVAMLRIDLEAL